MWIQSCCWERAIIPPGPLALPDTVDLVNLDENIKDVEIPELMWASLWNMNTLFFSAIQRCGCHRHLPGQQLQLFVKATTQELLQVLAADAVRRHSQVEESNQNVCYECGGFLFGSTPKVTIGRQRARLVILGYQHPELTIVQTAAPTQQMMFRHLFLQVHKLFLHIGTSLQLSCKRLHLKSIRT